ncbi:MAG: hypothetical protein L6R39_006296 [Caloplaca ligustica]|nr:MAG: hypothetical protein L6R39_006296 [Caloplaca ligustica]
MESSRSHRANSPTAFGIGERSPPSENPEGRIAKGLVSARIEAYRNNHQGPGDVGPAYPPSFPRARFERVQTQGGWPTHNAALYNQQHPRTLSLAIDTSPYTRHVLRGKQQSYDVPSQRLAAPAAVRSRRATNLVHLWESKAIKKDALSPLQPRWPVSHRIYRPVAEQQPADVVDLHRTVSPNPPNPPGMHATAADTSSLQHVEATYSCASTPFPQAIVQQNGIFKNPAGLLKYISHHNGGATTPPASDATDLDKGARSAADSEPEPEDSNPASDVQSDQRLTPDESCIVAGGTPPSGLRRDIQEPSSGSQATDNNSRSRQSWLQEGLRAESPRPDKSDKSPHRGRSMTQRQRHAGSLTNMPEGPIETLAERGRSSGDTRASEPHDTLRMQDTNQASTAADSTVASARSLSPPSNRQSSEAHARLAHGAFYRRVTECLSNSAYTFSLSPPAQEWRWWKSGRERSDAGNAIKSAERMRDPSMHTTSSSSSQYYSFEQSKPGSTAHDAGSPTVQIAGTFEQKSQGSTALEASGMLDAATQTETVHHVPAGTRSGWSDSGSIARDRRRRTYHWVLRPVHLKRRLRRRAVREIEVMVSLDGATNFVVNARFTSNGRNGRVREG